MSEDRPNMAVGPRLVAAPAVDEGTAEARPVEVKPVKVRYGGLNALKFVPVPVAVSAFKDGGWPRFVGELSGLTWLVLGAIPHEICALVIDFCDVEAYDVTHTVWLPGLAAAYVNPGLGLDSLAGLRVKCSDGHVAIIAAVGDGKVVPLAVLVEL